MSNNVKDWYHHNRRPARSRRLAEAVGGIILAVVIGISGALLLAHGAAGGFRTPHHVKVTGGSK